MGPSSHKDAKFKNCYFGNSLDSIGDRCVNLPGALPCNLELLGEFTRSLSLRRELYVAQHYPNLISSIMSFLRNKASIFMDIKNAVIRIVNIVAKNHGLKVQLSHRCKSPHSLLLKMYTQNLDFTNIYDIIGFRCIVLSEMDCYLLLKYLPYYIEHTKLAVLREVKDYISSPKDNGYSPFIYFLLIMQVSSLKCRCVQMPCMMLQNLVKLPMRVINICKSKIFCLVNVSIQYFV